VNRAGWRSGHAVGIGRGFHHLSSRAANMSDTESPAPVIIRTLGSLVSPPPTTISNKLTTTPAISSALRTTVTQISCPGRAEDAG
jgi:hypothetical protein